MYEVPCLDINGNTINRFYQWDIDQKIVIKLKGCDKNYLKNTPEVHFCNTNRTEAFIVRSLKFGTICVDSANVYASASTSSTVITTLNKYDKIVYSEYTDGGGDIGTASEDGSEWCSFEYKSEKRYIKTNCIEHNGETIIADVPNILLQEDYPLLIYVYLTDANDSSSQKTILFSEIPVRKRAKPSDYLYVDNINRVTANMIKSELEQSTKKTREDAINTINQTKSNAVNSVTNTKNNVENALNDTKAHHTTEINTARDEAKTTIDTAKNEFITTGNGLVTTATEIKNNTQKTYDNTVTVANNTKTTIETNIRTMLTQNGLSLKTVNDGSGDVTLSILINQA